MDAATASGGRLSVARMFVEVDILQTLPAMIWIGNGDHEGIGQNFFPESTPKYCSHCFRQGPDKELCHVLI